MDCGDSSLKDHMPVFGCRAMTLRVIWRPSCDMVATVLFVDHANRLEQNSIWACSCYDSQTGKATYCWQPVMCDISTRWSRASLSSGIESAFRPSVRPSVRPVFRPPVLPLPSPNKSSMSSMIEWSSAMRGITCNYGAMLQCLFI